MYHILWVNVFIKLGAHDIFMLKYDSSGSLLWTRQLGGSSNDVAFGVVVSSDGFIYVTGFTNNNMYTTNAGE